MTARVYRCGQCGRKLKMNRATGKGRWVYSEHTATRYCYPGEGCWNNNRKGK